MPTSTYSHINFFCTSLLETSPKSFLDVGLGNGKMGFLARDVLDVMLRASYHKDNWKTKIDGIEIFPDYIQDHQRAIYDNIYIGDALEVIDKLEQYDMVYIGDVLEHFPKKKGWNMLKKCIDHSTSHIILAIPLGKNWEQPELYGNPHEEHKSSWIFEDFEPFVYKKEFLHLKSLNDYGIFLIKCKDFHHYQIRKESDLLFDQGKREYAVSSMIKSLGTLPPDITSECLLVDHLLQLKRFDDAIERLTAASHLFPEDQSMKSMLHQLKNTTALGKG